MEIIIKSILLILFLLPVYASFGQKIITGNNKYLYDQHLYDFKDLGNILAADFDSYVEYKSALNEKKTIKKLVTYGIVSFTLGGILPMLEGGNCETICWADTSVSKAFLVSAIIIGIAGLILNYSYNDKKAKAIDIFNQSKEIGQIEEPSYWNISFGSAPHGVGLTINF